jgi:tetratricopeptide (TPR) repeat protein
MIDRVGNWSRRHRRLVAASSVLAAVALIGLSVGNVLISQERERSEQNFQRAERHFRDAQIVVDHFGSRLAERLKDISGADEIRQELLTDTLHYYENFVQEAATDPALRSELALTHSKIGQLAEQIGTTEDAIGAQRKALALLKQLIEEQPQSQELLRHASAVQNNLALALQRTGLTLESRQAFEQAIERQQQLSAMAPADARIQQELALSYNNVGLLLAETGNATEAETAFHKAIEIQKQIIQREPDNAECLRMLAASLNNLASLHKSTQDQDKLALYEQASQHLLRASLARPQESAIKSDLALAFNNLGSTQSRMGKLNLAVTAFTRAIEIQELLVQIAPLQRTYRRDLAVSFNNLGLAQSKLKKPVDAEQSFAKALAMQEVLVAQNPQDVELASSLGGIFNNRGIMLEELNRPRDAAESYRRAIEHQKLAAAHAKGVERYRTFLAKHYYNFGRALRKLGQGEEAAAAAIERSKLAPHDAQRQFSAAEELALANQILVRQQRAHTANAIGVQAIEHLKRAKALGMTLPENLQIHQSFAGLANDPQFLALAENREQNLLQKNH